MAKINPKDQEALQQEKLEATISKTEDFFESNKKILYGTAIGLIVLAALIVGYQKFIAQPRKAEALSQLYPAEANFRNQNYDIALNGDGNTLGFAQVLDQYGAKAGKAAYLYAGVCELNLGNFNEAISYLKKFSGKDKIMSARALACIGDAYVGLEDYKTALGYFEKAAAVINNIYVATYLLKAGVVCEELGDSVKALSFYNKIKDQYPSSMEGYDIDKYISRAETAIANK